MEVIKSYIAIKFMKLGSFLHNIGFKIHPGQWGVSIHLEGENISLVKRVNAKGGQFVTEAINMPLSTWERLVQKISFKK